MLVIIRYSTIEKLIQAGKVTKLCRYIIIYRTQMALVQGKNSRAFVTQDSSKYAMQNSLSINITGHFNLCCKL